MRNYRACIRINAQNRSQLIDVTVSATDGFKAEAQILGQYGSSFIGWFTHPIEITR